MTAKNKRWIGVCLIIGGLGSVLLFRDSARPLLPFAFILLCPLMHIFMMGGHGHRSDHKEKK